MSALDQMWAIIFLRETGGIYFEVITARKNLTRELNYLSSTARMLSTYIASARNWARPVILSRDTLMV